MICVPDGNGPYLRRLQNLSIRERLPGNTGTGEEIVTIKGLGSGTGSFIVAMALKEAIPGISYMALIMIPGYVAYGLSIFTYIRAQKTLRAAKTSAYYAIAPFVGVLLSALFLKESFTVVFIIALIIMIAGMALIVRDTLIHNHKHAHDRTHVINEEKHGHTHSISELEMTLGHRGESFFVFPFR